ncbi:MAG TPA: hypothetical protein PL033_11230 [Candidatus Brocadiia bacterium]|nr:hypothetical protein [Candidatus Brocadiia bacterium]
MNGLRLVGYILLCLVVPIAWGVITNLVFNRLSARAPAAKKENNDASRVESLRQIWYI